jgi:hypothetical protein
LREIGNTVRREVVIMATWKRWEEWEDAALAIAVLIAALAIVMAAMLLAVELLLTATHGDPPAR